jgi:hypothetical protein
MQFTHIPTVDGHPSDVVFFATKAWIDIIDNGNGWARFVPFSGTDSCILATDDDTIAGCIIYRLYRDASTAEIMVGCVDPIWRGKGLYGDLYDRLVAELLRENIYTIKSLVSRDNKPMLEFASMKRGRDVNMLMTREKLDRYYGYRKDSTGSD